jgi:hypothetical protein
MTDTSREALLASMPQLNHNNHTQDEVIALCDWANQAADMLEADAQFDTWAKNPYTLVLQKSIAEDYEPKKAQQVAVPEGYVLVPIEPTPMMLSAFHTSVNVWMKEIGEDSDIYKAMIKAAQGVKP